MRHSYFGRKLSRTKNERMQLFRNLTRDLFLHGKIVTTRAKAKAIVPLVDGLITKAKAGTDAKRRQVLAALPYKDVVATLWEQARSRFGSRTSGFTRMVYLGVRVGDASEKVLLSFVDDMPIEEAKPKILGKPVKQKKEAVQKEIKTKSTDKKSTLGRKRKTV